MMKGKTVAITRSREDSEEFIRLMKSGNANPVPLPTIELTSRGEKIVDDLLDSVARYGPDYSLFMSSKAVKLLFNAAGEASKLDDLRLAISGTIVMAVGPKTRAALEAYGIRVAHMPETYSSVGVGELFTRLDAVGKRVIVPRSGASTPFLKELLDKIGLHTMEVILYDVCAFRDTSQWNDFRLLFSENKVDGIVFTSASSVRAFFEIMENDRPREGLVSDLGKTVVVSIGPFTADELKKFGVQSTISGIHTVAGAFDAIKECFHQS